MVHLKKTPLDSGGLLIGGTPIFIFRFSSVFYSKINFIKSWEWGKRVLTHSHRAKKNRWRAAFIEKKQLKPCANHLGFLRRNKSYIASTFKMHEMLGHFWGVPYNFTTVSRTWNGNSPAPRIFLQLLFVRPVGPGHRACVGYAKRGLHGCFQK